MKESSITHHVMTNQGGLKNTKYVWKRGHDEYRIQVKHLKGRGRLKWKQSISMDIND